MKNDLINGPVVGGQSIMVAFCIIEESEESARMAYMLRKATDIRFWRKC